MIAFWQRLKAVEKVVEELKKAQVPTVSEKVIDESLEVRVKKLENNYKMMNARLSRGRND